MEHTTGVSCFGNNHGQHNISSLVLIDIFSDKILNSEMSVLFQGRNSGLQEDFSAWDAS